MKIRLFNVGLINKVDIKKTVSRVGAFFSSIVFILNLSACSVKNIEKSEEIPSQTITTSQNEEEVSSQIRDISKDYVYIYVGDNDNITIDSENFIEYKNTDNAFTREASTFEDSKVSMTTEQRVEFKEFLNDYKVEIPYSNLFNIEHLLERKGEYSVVEHSEKFVLTDGHVDSKELYKVVKNNNSGFPMTGYFTLTDEEIEKLCGIVSKTINYIIDNNKYVDINALCCNLSDLKILGEQNVTNARITYDNVLAVSKDMIESFQTQFKNDTNVYDLTVIHEASHLFQINCDDEVDKTKGNMIGFTQKWSDEPINSLFWKWYYEASAETLMTDMTGADNIVYENMTNYLKYLKMTQMPVGSFDINSLEEVSVSRNIDDFFQIFNASTMEDKVLLSQIMYGIEIIQNEDKNFAKLYINYNLLNNNSLSVSEWATLKRTIKVGIAINLSRMFYQNLSDYICSSNSATLNDIFRLITMYEAEIESHVIYDSIDLFEINRPFMESYKEIQEAFFRSLSTEKGYSYEDIVIGFNSYSLDDVSSLTDFSDESLDFFDKRSKELIKHITTNITNTYKTLSEQYDKQKDLILN